MEIWGISLQLAAGIILGLPYVLPEQYFNTANGVLRTVLLSPLSQKRLLVGISLVSGVLAVSSIFVVPALRNGYPDLNAFEVVFGVVFASSIGGTAYLWAILMMFRLMRRAARLKRLFENRDYRVFLLANLFVMLVTLLIGYGGLFGFQAMQLAVKTSHATGIGAAMLSSAFLLLYLFTAIVLLAAIASIVFLAVALLLICVAAMTKPVSKPLWVLVLLLFTLGGVLLIVNAATK